jgi:hypothetical protein
MSDALGVQSPGGWTTDAGSCSSKPTSTSPTIRPPTGPRRLPSPCGLAQDVIPERRFAPPSGCLRAHLVGRERGHPDVPRDQFTRGQPDILSTLQVAHGQRMEFVDFTFTCQRDRQGDERADDLAVNLLGSIGRRLAVRVEQSGPLDAVGGRDGTEPNQIGKERHRFAVPVHAVAVPNLGMSITVGGVCELQGDVGIARRPVEAAIARQQRARQVDANQPRQELAHHDRLVTRPVYSVGAGLRSRSLNR